MYELLWLVPAFPFAGFLALALFGRAVAPRAAAVIGTGSVGLSALLVLYIGTLYVNAPPDGGAFTQTLWTWMSAGGFTAAATLRLDALSLLMAFVVTFVGFLIHLYSTEYMSGDGGYSRFFSYMNLFTGSMLLLVLSGNILFLYLGWEGVGLCSYLLIGFWYTDERNGYAARKAFIVTRIGDTFFMIGLLFLVIGLGATDIQGLMSRAQSEWAGTMWPYLAAILLLGGALGKSAQLPLQTWLPDAMAGPTPVSALIHAATMVTAGVYLIARTRPLFELAPEVLTAVAIIGAATLLVASFSALAQRDIKRILAYSTISQIGYMFLALGVGAYSAAMFHFMTHAFFKALLFLAAGAVILGMHHEHDIFRMGGLRREMPFVFWTFLAGAVSLAALPFVTAGFYSKDLIFHFAWSSNVAGPLLWACGLTGAFLTALYTFRLVFIAFFGEATSKIEHRPGIRLGLPLAALAILSITAGFIETPSFLGGAGIFSAFLSPVLPASPPETEAASAGLVFAGAITPIAGLIAAWYFFLFRRKSVEALSQRPAAAALHAFWHSGWGFDRLYDIVFVRPYLWLARAGKGDPVDNPFRWMESLSTAVNGALAKTQNGNVRWYAAGITIGAVLAISAVLL